MVAPNNFRWIIGQAWLTVKSLVPAKLDEITASGAKELMIYVSNDIEFELFIKSDQLINMSHIIWPYACIAMIYLIYYIYSTSYILINEKGLSGLLM